ncbi:beta-1,4-glucuronyltransferase 1-like isoform X2 [Aethina tumida]|uniref:beta-1,4-glucuronyltransferase 1-like isoform X2 n=1 Tax=Aethina tumida TaxID=116153 RepID=UPI00214750E4|nr:beta-1,4-glucuronyltransferase 1-like isoform X2 [Aethina tumida]
MDNLALLAHVWRGPISVALYTPGHDFDTTVKSIAYTRQCTYVEVKHHVTFHLFFEAAHTFENGTKPLLELYEDTYDCSKGPPYKDIKDEDMYKSKNNLLFPINVARNVARDAARTHFIFPSDIELYPTPNFVNKFLDFVQTHGELFIEGQRNVFVLPVFEMKEGYDIPSNKTQLQTMIKNKTAFLFHKNICASCHKVVDGNRWITEPETEGLNVFSVGKRQGTQVMWEPFYVCTHKEPLFDERMSWEGQANKMSMAYSLCLLDYDFMVLDNAFLVHKPGIKVKKVQNLKYKNVTDKSTKLLKYHASVELKKIYGNNPKCRIM